MGDQAPQGNGKNPILLFNTRIFLQKNEPITGLLLNGANGLQESELIQLQTRMRSKRDAASAQLVYKGVFGCDTQIHSMTPPPPSHACCLLLTPLPSSVSAWSLSLVPLFDSSFLLVPFILFQVRRPTTCAVKWPCVPSCADSRRPRRFSWRPRRNFTSIRVLRARCGRWRSPPPLATGVLMKLFFLSDLCVACCLSLASLLSWVLWFCGWWGWCFAVCAGVAPFGEGGGFTSRVFNNLCSAPQSQAAGGRHEARSTACVYVDPAGEG